MIRFTLSLTNKEIMQLSRSLSFLLGSGISITRTFELVGERSRKMKELFRQLSFQIEMGNTLEQALRIHHDYFPLYFIEIVAAGERIGALAQVFKELADDLEKKEKMRRELWVKVSYPLMIVFCGLVIIPFLTSCAKIHFFSESNGHYSGQIISLIRHCVLFVGLVVGITLIGRINLLKTILEKMLIWVPFIGYLVKQMAYARFFWIFSLLLGRGLPPEETLKRAAAAAGSNWITKDMKLVVQRIGQGKSFEEALEKTTFLTPMGREMLLVGESTGTIPETWKKVSEWIKDETYHRLYLWISVLDGILILAIGFGIVIGK